MVNGELAPPACSLRLLHKGATRSVGLPLPFWGEGWGEGVTGACEEPTYPTAVVRLRTLSISDARSR
jgi:hypothetical protein